MIYQHPSKKPLKFAGLPNHVLVSINYGQAYRQRWNRSTNNKRGAGNNVPLDLDLEHDNNYLTEGLKKLGPNLTQSSVLRCAT